MKHLTFFLSVLLLGLFSSFAQCDHIGVVQDNSYVITCNQSLLKSCLQKVLTLQGNKTVISSLEIKSAKDSSGRVYYYLLAKDDNNTMKMATGLTLNNGVFNLALTDGNSTSCTCTGCSDSCDPYQNLNGTWRCLNSCSPKAGCKKSVTATSAVEKCLNL